MNKVKSYAYDGGAYYKSVYGHLIINYYDLSTVEYAYNDYFTSLLNSIQHSLSINYNSLL